MIETDHQPAIGGSGMQTAALPVDSTASPESMAAALEKSFASAADRLAAGTLTGSTDAQAHASFADLLVRRPTLFLAGGSLSPNLADSMRKFVAGQAEIASEIVLQSPTAPVLWDGSGVEETILIRGVAKNRGDVVPRRFLEAIAGANQKPFPKDCSGRLQLARSMLADDNPFTARVMVNRVWQHLFGRGIVPTVDNFGVLGSGRRILSCSIIWPIIFERIRRGRSSN